MYLRRKKKDTEHPFLKEDQVGQVEIKNYQKIIFLKFIVKYRCFKFYFSTVINN